MNKAELEDLIGRAKPHLGKFKPVRIGRGKNKVNINCQFVRIGNAVSVSENSKENYRIDGVLIAPDKREVLEPLKSIVAHFEKEELSKNTGD